MLQLNYKEFFPGFAMGVTRSIISHPFEILKIQSQLHLKQTKNNLFNGLHYSIISSGMERGIQFFAYDHFRKNDNNIISALKSSILSTFIGVPYNFLMIKTQKTIINDHIFHKIIPLEYTKSLIGSSIFLYTYNEVKSKKYPLWFSSFCGTTLSWLTIYPIDTIRNIIIGYNTHTNIKLRCLYRGVHYPVLRSIPSSICGMYVYEEIKNFL